MTFIEKNLFIFIFLINNLSQINKLKLNKKFLHAIIILLKSNNN